MEVGRYKFAVEDKSRYEVLGYSSGNRKLEVIVYYPVDDSSVKGKKKGKYVSDVKLEHIHPAYKKGIKKFYPDTINLYDNVKPIDEKFPIVFFSHGFGGFAEQNTRMVIDLVKSGFIVVSVGHTFEASVVELDNGAYYCMDKNAKACSPMIPALFAQSRLMRLKSEPIVLLEEFDKFQNKYCKYMKGRVKVWADDVIFVLNHLKTQDTNERFILSGKMDFDNIGTTGHSFGGCISYYLCMNNPEFKCGINIDGALFGDYEGFMTKPFMLITCESNLNIIPRILSHRRTDTYRVIMKKQKHIGLSDAKYIIPNKSFCGSLNIEKMENALFAAHREFFSKYLKAHNSNFEDLEKATNEEIVFERYEEN